MKLSDNHKRVVFSTLKVVESRIDKIELMILNKNIRHSYKVQNDLNEEEIKTVLEIIRNTRNAIGKLFIKYDLKPTVVILSDLINASKAFIWKDIIETDTKSLLRYGIFTKNEDPVELDKDLKAILALTEKLNDFNTLKK